MSDIPGSSSEGTSVFDAGAILEDSVTLAAHRPLQYLRVNSKADEVISQVVVKGKG